MYARNLLYTGMLFTALSAPGCSYILDSLPASRGRVSALEQTVDKISQEQRKTASDVQQIQTLPLADRKRMFTLGEGYDKEVGMLLEVVLSQYKNPKSREIARKGANAVALVPVPKKNEYFAVLINEDGDKLAVEGEDSKDKSFFDFVDGKKVFGYIINGNNVPKVFKDLLIKENNIGRQK